MPLMINGKKPERTGQREKCPYCEVEVISVCGKIRIRHWRHFKKGSCVFAGETDWHIGWKEFFSNCGCRIEQIYAFDEVKRIADVVLENGTVVEIQNNPNPDTFADRCRHYGSAGIAWIFRAKAFLKKPKSIEIPTFEGEIQEIVMGGRQKRLKLIIGEAIRLGVPLFIDAPEGLYWICHFEPKVVGVKICSDQLFHILLNPAQSKTEYNSVVEAALGNIKSQIQDLENKMNVILHEVEKKQDLLLSARNVVDTAVDQYQDVINNIMVNEKRAFLSMLRKDTLLIQKESIMNWILKFIELARDIQVLRKIRECARFGLHNAINTNPCTSETIHEWAECSKRWLTLRQEWKAFAQYFGKKQDIPGRLYPMTLPKCKIETNSRPISSRLLSLMEMPLQEVEVMFRAQATQFIEANYVEPSMTTPFLERVEAIIVGREEMAMNIESTSLIESNTASKSVKESIVSQSAGSVDYQNPVSQPGSCIRCRTQISLNPARPMCPKCFSRWAEYNNPYYNERFCHVCGRPWRTTIDWPLCKPCECRMGQSSNSKQPKRPRTFHEGIFSY